MSKKYENQHYVSQVLLKRFAGASGLVQRFCLKTNKWKAKHPKRIFARLGYTQILVDGTVDNSLEQSFQTLESSLPDVLAALDSAANGGNKKLSDDMYNKLMWYCAYLWGLSPFAKAASPLHYVIQLDSDLKSGRTELLKMIGIKETDFGTIRGSAFQWSQIHPAR